MCEENAPVVCLACLVDVPCQVEVGPDERAAYPDARQPSCRVARTGLVDLLAASLHIAFISCILLHVSSPLGWPCDGAPCCPGGGAPYGGRCIAGAILGDARARGPPNMPIISGGAPICPWPIGEAALFCRCVIRNFLFVVSQYILLLLGFSVPLHSGLSTTSQEHLRVDAPATESIQAAAISVVSLEGGAAALGWPEGRLLSAFRP